MSERILAVLTETIDIIGGRNRIGGPAYYSSITLMSLGAEFSALLTGKVMQAVLEHSGYPAASFCETPTVFEFVSPEPRVLRLVRKCFKESLEIPAGDYEFALVSLTMSEAPLNSLHNLAREVNTVIVDAQGYVRDVGHDAVVFNSPLLSAMLFRELARLQRIGKVIVAKASEDELPELDYIREFIHSGGTLIVTRGGRTSTLVAKEKCVSITPPQIIGDSTGAGDVMLAAMTSYLARGKGIEESFIFGIAAGSIRLAKKEPPWILWSEIESLARRLRPVECDSIGDSTHL